MMVNFRTKDRRCPTVTLQRGEAEAFVVNGVRFQFKLADDDHVRVTIQKCKGYSIYRLGGDVELTVPLPHVQEITRQAQD